MKDKLVKDLEKFLIQIKYSKSANVYESTEATEFLKQVRAYRKNDMKEVVEPPMIGEAANDNDIEAGYTHEVLLHTVYPKRELPFYCSDRSNKNFKYYKFFRSIKHHE